MFIEFYRIREVQTITVNAEIDKTEQEELIVWLNITVSVCQICTILLLIMQFSLKRTLEWKSEGFIRTLSAIDLTMKTTGESLPLFETQLHLLKRMFCAIYNSQTIESTSMFISR